MFEEDARALAEELVRGDYAAVSGRLPPVLVSGFGFSEDGLRLTMEKTVRLAGQVREIGQPRSFTTVELLLTFERGATATLRVSFDQAGSIVDLLLTPFPG